MIWNIQHGTCRLKIVDGTKILLFFCNCQGYCIAVQLAWKSFVFNVPPAVLNISRINLQRNQYSSEKAGYPLKYNVGFSYRQAKFQSHLSQLNIRHIKIITKKRTKNVHKEQSMTKRTSIKMSLVTKVKEKKITKN